VDVEREMDGAVSANDATGEGPEAREERRERANEDLLGATDGIETTRRIRALPAPRGRVPIIGISGHDDAARMQAARVAGMDRYLIKPVTPRVLADAIASVIGARG